MDALHLGLLGGFRLLVEDRPLAVPHGGQRLLALIALRQGAPRSVIAGTLWPEVGESRAVGNLRCVRWRLPRRDLVVADGGELRLHDAITVDLAHRTALGQSLVQDADPAAFVAELLPGWDEPWLDLPREHYREAGLRALERQGVALLADGRLLDALACARAVVDTDPLGEPAYRLLMEIHLAEGNAAAALRVQQGYAELLRRELDLSPSARMQALVGHLPRPRDAAVTVP